MTDDDAAVVLALAVVMIMVAVCVWPGLGRVRRENIVGFWGTADGKLFEIRAADGGERALTVQHGAQTVAGALSGVRGLRVGALSGRVGLGGAQIHWRDGSVWHFQGIR